MNYSDYNDYELLDYVLENNEVANEIIYKKYEPIIKNIAAKIYPYCKNNGVELSDLIQEGMIGLVKATQHFKDNKEASFYTFAVKCIERNMIDLKNSSNRLKHKVLNDSLPIEIESEDGGFNLESFLKSDMDSPEKLLVNKEREKHLIKELQKVMTPLEIEVFKLKYVNYNYKEISKMLNKTPKQIDNALQRIKIKLNSIIEKEV